jgi:inosose dehydratase
MENSVKLGVSPLSWTNEVILEFGNDTPGDTCLNEAAWAGYQGVETGRNLPADPNELRAKLEARNLQLISGWHSGFLAERSLEEEIEAVRSHARLLQDLGCSVLVYGECALMPPENPLDLPMSSRVIMPPDNWAPYASKLTRFAEHLADKYGLRLAYHHHLMMIVEKYEEICALFDHCGPEVGLLLDTGHAAAAGFDYSWLVRDFSDRICHIHLKDVRSAVQHKVQKQDLSFNQAVCEGMFTVPGDGDVDFSAVFQFVQEGNYHGWMVVEAEQDPVKAPPRETVRRAFEFVAEGV